MDWNRYATAVRLRIWRPIVRARGSLLRRLRPPPEAVARPGLDDVPVLLVGCHRSGTSLVRRCVDSHSRLACGGESLLLEHLGAVLDSPSAARGLAGLDLTPDAVATELGAVAERWFRDHARRQGKPRWADKSPGNTVHLEGIDQLFGRRPQYVCIARDGMDVATSLGGATPPWWQLEPWLRAEPDPYLAACRYWVDLNQKMLAFRDRHPERCLLFRYEELIREPEPALRRLFTFLGEAFEPQTLDFNRQAHSGGLEDHHVSTSTTFEDNTGRHRALPPALQRRMWAIVGETMEQLGYGARSYDA
jgi:protein-tyrosine sulfotransferase